MGKKIVGVIAFAAIAVVAGWNYQQNKNEVVMSNLVLENVDALARYEDNYCPNGCLDQSGDGCWCYREYPHLQEAKWN